MASLGGMREKLERAQARFLPGGGRHCRRGLGAATRARGLVGRRNRGASYGCGARHHLERRPDAAGNGHPGSLFPTSAFALVAGGSTDHQAKVAGGARSLPVGGKRDHDGGAALRRAREQTLAFLAETETRDLRRYYWRHPFLGMLNGYEWMEMIAAHQNRHTKQMREIAEKLSRNL